MDSLQDYPESLKVLLDLLQREIARLTSRLELKEIDVEEWQRTMEALIARYSAAAYMTGAGTDELSTLARESLVMHTQAQLGFLDNFAVAIASEPEFMKGWQARAESYAKTIVVPYWQGQTKLLPLPAMPAEGTQCLNNCKCKWEIIPVNEAAGDFDCYWRLMPAEHCQTCTERARTWNPIRIRGGRIQLKERIKLSLVTHKHLAGQHDQATHGRRHMGAIGHGPGGSLPYKNILGARLSELPAEYWEEHTQENIDPDAWKTWVKGTPIPRVTTAIRRPNIEKYFSEHPGGMLVFREATTGHGPKGPDSRRVYYYALHRNVRPGEGPWRVTEIDEWGPVGHQAYDTPASLAKDFYKSYGYYFGRHSKAKGGFEFLGALDSTVANKALWAVTFKHLAGQHDQKLHGSWAHSQAGEYKLPAHIPEEDRKRLETIGYTEADNFGAAGVDAAGYWLQPHVAIVFPDGKTLYSRKDILYGGPVDWARHTTLYSGYILAHPEEFQGDTIPQMPEEFKSWQGLIKPDPAVEVARRLLDNDILEHGPTEKMVMDKTGAISLDTGYNSLTRKAVIGVKGAESFQPASAAAATGLLRSVKHLLNKFPPETWKQGLPDFDQLDLHLPQFYSLIDRSALDQISGFRRTRNDYGDETFDPVFKEIHHKHLPGKHDQKRHGWRFGSTNQIQAALRQAMDPSLSNIDRRSSIEEIKRRARIRRGVHPALAALHHIRDVEARIANRQTEMAYAFDENGVELFHTEGDQSSVSFSEEQKLKAYSAGNAIMTHNHPGFWMDPKETRGREPETIPFSPSDLSVAANLNLAEIRVTGPGRYTYSMTKPSSGYWPDPYMLHSLFGDARHDFYPAFLDQIRSGKPVYQAEIQMRIRIWDAIAKKLGMDFNVETGPSRLPNSARNEPGYRYTNEPVNIKELIQLKHLPGKHDQKLHGSWARQARIRTRRELGPEFARWFGKSKVVDAKGRPLVVYHGTPTSGEHSNNKYVRGEQAGHEFPEFDRFNTQTSGITDSGWLGQGTYFTPDPDFAWEFGNKIMPVYLKVEKPFVINDDHSSGMENLYDFRKSIQDLPGLPEELRLDTHLAESVTYESYGKEKITRYLSAGPGIDTQGRNRFFVFSGSAPDRQFIIESSGRTREEAIARYNWKRNNTEPEGFILHDIGKIGAARFTSILKAAGYDGVMEYRITRDENENPVGKGILSEILVFEPTQIKSSIANIGTWDPNNPSITKEIRYKHMPGGHAHDQKRHGWRYGSTNQIQDTLRRIRNDARYQSFSEWRLRSEEFKRRARIRRGMPAKEALYHEIEDLEKQMRRSAYESCVVLDPEGRKITAKQGDQHKITFEESEIQKIRGKDAIFTHNHPGDQGLPDSDMRNVEGLPFSHFDLGAAANMDLAEVRAVSSGRKTYIMRRPAKGWPAPEKMYELFFDFRQRLSPDYYKRIVNHELPEDEANYYYHSDIIKSVAQQIGADYIVKTNPNVSYYETLRYSPAAKEAQEAIPV